MIAFRKASPAMTLGEIEFLPATEQVLAFVRRHEGEAIGCVFNLSDRPVAVEVAGLAGGELLMGEAELRGASLGLAPYAAAFLRLP